MVYAMVMVSDRWLVRRRAVDERSLFADGWRTGLG